MSLLEAIETFENGLMWIGLGALLLMATACALVGMHRVGKALCVRLRPAAIGVFAVAAIFATCEAQKRLLRDGGGRGATALPGVTAEEIAQGWRLESVTTNDAVLYAMPTNGVEYRPWFLRGGYETHFPLDLEFGFPFGTGVVWRVDVLSGGMVESYPRPSAMSICAAREWASIVPGVGRFWWADAARPESAPYQVKLLTWENVYAGRDCTGQYNAQIELRGDGNFVTRSNNVERIYCRVEPFDWDGDGLENTVDPEPLVAGVDAHGTNAEWFNTMCSNVLEALQGDGGAMEASRPTLSWCDGVNSNAYYFVDVVAANGPAPIYFTGDRETRLGNPVIVVRGGETNHVPLLVGVNYAVTSTVPFSFSPPDEGFASIATHGVSNYEVRWPLNFVFTESMEGSGRVYAVTVEPYDPSGDLAWSGDGGLCSGGLRAGASSGCGCGCLECDGVELPIIDHALAADERFHVTGVYEGAEASTSTNDVTLSGTFTEYFTSQQLHSDGRLTVVRVELRPKVVAPNNGSLNRHRYGVRELVQHVQEPLAPAVTWNPVGGGSDETVGLHDYYRCPLYGCENPLRAEIGATAYPFNVEVVEPEGMKSKATRALVYSNAVHRGESGGIGMELRMYVTPLDVSFSEIAVQEVPCSTYTVEGFFENPYFNGAFAHTGGPFGVGAGHWIDVKPDDNMLDGFDTAAYATKIPWLTPSGMPTTNSAYAWTEGHAYMDTPLGWNVKGTRGNIPPCKRFGEDLQQVFRIDQHGRVGVFKLDNWVIRTTNDVVTLRGPITAELP